MRYQLIKEYYESPEYLSKLRARVTNLKEMHENELVRAERLLDIYANDPIRFIEDFCFLKLTEYDAQPKPFFMFDYQKRIVKKLQEWEDSHEEIDCLIDKPRGMGVTWLITTYFTWRWLFSPNYSNFLLSRTESEVDDGTSNPDGCIMGKIRWQLNMMPRWMMPEGYKPKSAKGTSTDSSLKLLNPQIGTSIIGSSTNSNAGRSRRYSTTFLDECFYIDHFLEVNRALQSVSRMKIYVSTTVESKTAKDFMERCKKQGTYLPLTWKDHPWKDQQWYDELAQKAKDLDDPDLMREAQIDYSVSPKSQYYPTIAQSDVCELDYNPQRPLYISLDMGGKQDLTVIGWWQFNGINFDLLEAYENTNKPTIWYAPFFTPNVILSDVEAALKMMSNTEFNGQYYNDWQKKFIEETVKKMNKPIAYFGELDHTIKRRPTNQSDADVLRPYGVQIRYNPYAIDHPPRHTATAQMLPRIRFNSKSSAVMKVYDAVANSKYSATTKTTSENLKPIHGTDGTADRRVMVENMCVSIGRVLRQQRKDVTDTKTRDFASSIIRQLRA